MFNIIVNVINSPQRIQRGLFKKILMMKLNIYVHRDRGMVSASPLTRRSRTFTIISLYRGDSLSHPNSILVLMLSS